MDTPSKKYMELTITNERFYFYLFSLGWLRESDRFFALPLPLHSAIKTILFALSKINAYKRLQCKHCSRDFEHTFLSCFRIGFRSPTSFHIAGNCTQNSFGDCFFVQSIFFKFFLGEFRAIEFRFFIVLRTISPIPYTTEMYYPYAFVDLYCINNEIP